MRMIALIPARAGSKRIPHKNVRLLAGHPLIEYTIAAAIESGVFAKIAVATDDPLVRVPMPGAMLIARDPVPDDQADIVWVRDALLHVVAETFAILRPTSPFRTAATIRRAYEQFRTTPDVHSMRAVEPARHHPGKMWYWHGDGYPIAPVLHGHLADGTPWHSAPTQTLPKVFVQNASLEMAWSYVPLILGTISGTKVLPFFTEGYEGLDLNTEDDWREAERLIAEGKVELPPISLARV